MRYASEGRHLTLYNGVLNRVANPSSSTKGLTRLQLVIPTSLRNEALYAAHDALVGGGHLGVEKTYGKILERWWWPGVYLDVKHYVNSCKTCGRMSKEGSPEGGKLESISVSEPFELVGMDIVGKLPTTARGYKYILVVTCHFSKWAFAIPMNGITTKDVAQELLTKVILTGHGMPRRILTDRGSNFNSELAREVYRLLDIAKSTTSAYHPQCDGHTERFNKTLGIMLAKLMEDHPLDWDELLPYCVFAYNISMHASTKLSPYYILYGREPKLPMDHMFGTAEYDKPKSTKTYVRQLQNRLEEISIIAKANMEEAQHRQKASYDERKSHTLQPLQPGEKVWVKNYTKPKVGESAKFIKKWLGPYTVVDAANDSKYLIKGEDFPEQMVHIQRLRRYDEREQRGPSEEMETNEGKDKGTTDKEEEKSEKITKEKDQEMEAAGDKKKVKEKKQKRKDESEDGIVEDKEEGKDDEGEIQEEKIEKILAQSGDKRNRKYHVQWSSGEQTWVDEEDLNCPALLIEFVKKQEQQPPPPHHLLQTLLGALEAYLKIIQNRKDLTVSGIKRQLRRDFIGDGNPFLKSRRVIVKLEAEVANAGTKEVLSDMISRWLTQANHTFAEEWDK